MKCTYENCKKPATYGLDSGAAIYCGPHSGSSGIRMLKLSLTCAHAGCSLGAHSYYGLDGKRCCKRHSLTSEELVEYDAKKAATKKAAEVLNPRGPRNPKTCIVEGCPITARFGYFADGALWCNIHKEPKSKLVAGLCKQIGCKLSGGFYDVNNVKKCMNHSLSPAMKADREKAKLLKEKMRAEAKVSKPRKPWTPSAQTLENARILAHAKKIVKREREKEDAIELNSWFEDFKRPKKKAKTEVKIE
jgi:hypothetical protein